MPVSSAISKISLWEGRVVSVSARSSWKSLFISNVVLLKVNLTRLPFCSFADGSTENGNLFQSLFWQQLSKFFLLCFPCFIISFLGLLLVRFISVSSEWEIRRQNQTSEQEALGAKGEEGYFAKPALRRILN